MIRLIRDGMKVVSAFPSFAGEISNLRTAAFGFNRSVSLTEHRIKEKMADPRYETYGYLRSGTLAGFFFLFVPDYIKPKEIESFCVAPWHKGKGIGSVMLQFILDKYSLYDFRLIVASKNDAAMGFYKKFGFVETHANKAQTYMKRRAGE